MVRHLGRISFRHHLNVHLPTRKLLTLNRLIQVTLRAFAIFTHQLSSFGIRQVFDPLLRNQMKLNPEAFVISIDKAKSVRAKTMHMAVAGRNTAVTHDDGDLVQRLRQASPEVPVIDRTAHIGAWITLHRMVQVRKFQWVAKEEYWGVITHQVPVTLFRIKAHGKAANIPLSICRTTLTCYGRKAHKHLGFLANLGEQSRFAVLGDVMSHHKLTKCTRAFGMHATLGNYLTVKVSHFLQKPNILEQHRTTCTCGQTILVVGNRST